MNKPLISCVMPTWNRRVFIPAAIDCFLKQTYENRELVILDDGEEPIQDLIPKDDRIRYVFENKRRITGDKRNRVNELAKGEIICHWDDDDWSAADRIEFQLELLLRSKLPVTGFGTMYFWNVTESKPLIYRSQPSGYVLGTSLFYQKEFWQVRHFKEIHENSDGNFVYPRLRSIAASSDPNHMVARIHGIHHTSSKSAVRESVSKDKFPAEFWANEKLRRNE